MPDRLTTFPVVTTKLELRRQSFLSLNLKIEMKMYPWILK